MNSSDSDIPCAEELAEERPAVDVDDGVQEGAAGTESTKLNVSPRTISWSRVMAFGLLPTAAVMLASAAGFQKWHDGTARDSTVAQVESLQSAKDACVALLSYEPDKVDTQLHAASQLLTGEFKKSYADLTTNVVIPGAKQKDISSVASVAAASSVSASPRHAVTLVFIDQTVIVGNDAPSATSSAVRVTLDNIENHWLVSGFDPV